MKQRYYYTKVIRDEYKGQVLTIFYSDLFDSNEALLTFLDGLNRESALDCRKGMLFWHFKSDVVYFERHATIHGLEHIRYGDMIQTKPQVRQL